MMYNRDMKWRYSLEFNLESFDEKEPALQANH